jgi:hypothetical protein
VAAAPGRSTALAAAANAQKTPKAATSAQTVRVRVRTTHRLTVCGPAKTRPLHACGLGAP